MKKMISAILLLFSFSSLFAFNHEVEEVLPIKKIQVIKTEQINKTIINEVDKKLSSTENKEDAILCTVTCSITFEGVTYTASAGNFLSSCRRSTVRCDEKLMHMLF